MAQTMLVDSTTYDMLNIGMEVLKGKKFRLNVSKETSKLLLRWSGLLRRLYNAAISQRRMAYELCRKSVTRSDQQAELVEIRKAFPEFKEVPSQALQYILKRVDDAYQNFFQGLTGFPKFKRRKDYLGFHFPQFKKESIRRLSQHRGTVELPKLGRVDFRWSQAVEGEIRSCSLSFEGNHWYISFLAKVDIKAGIIPTSSLGIDLGCNTSIALSKPIDGHDKFNLPIQEIKKIEDAIAHRQQVMSHKKKGSRAWKRCVQHIRRLYHHLTCIRRNFIHQITTQIVDTQGYIFVEDLDVKEMTQSASGTLEQPGTKVAQKRGLNRSIQRQGWGLVINFLDYKSKWKFRNFRKVDPKYTSQTCHLCKYVSKENRERGSTTFQCQRCGFVSDADINAAYNVEEAGLALIASEDGLQHLPRNPSATSYVMSGIPHL